jgi:hypothetical protein
MTDILVKMKDGREQWFKHQNRPGGSYTKEAKYCGSFLVIVDEYYNETAIPAQDIAEVKVYKK